MSLSEPGAGGIAAGLIERARGMLTAPSAEWAKIDKETPDTAGLLLRYALPLAALSAICGFIGQSMFGASAFGVTVKIPFVQALISAVVACGLSLGLIWVFSWLINFLAPSFGGQKNEGKALQVATYATTAPFLAGVFQIFPVIAFLGIIGVVFYCVHLHGGLKAVMKAPDEKATGYTATVVVVGLVLAMLMFGFVGCVAGTAQLAQVGAGIARDGADGTVTLPNGGQIDLGKMEDAAKKMEEAAKQMEAGGGAALPAVDLEALKALVPETLPGGWKRFEISTGSSGALGFGAAGVTGRYEKGDSRLELQVADLSGMGAMAGFASAFGVQSSTENANGYERVVTKDGQFVMEKLDRAMKTAEYTALVGDRFVVSASGTNVTEADVKAAFATVSPDQLKALAAKAQPAP
jgi:hypothetical protein